MQNETYYSFIFHIEGVPLHKKEKKLPFQRKISTNYVSTSVDVVERTRELAFEKVKLQYSNIHVIRVVQREPTNPFIASVI